MCRSDGKESVCSAGDLGSIPELGRSPGEGTWETSHRALEMYNPRNVGLSKCASLESPNADI